MMGCIKNTNHKNRGGRITHSRTTPKGSDPELTDELDESSAVGRPITP